MTRAALLAVAFLMSVLSWDGVAFSQISPNYPFGGSPGTIPQYTGSPANPAAPPSAGDAKRSDRQGKPAQKPRAARSSANDERHLILTRSKHDHDPDYVMQSQATGKGVELRVVGDGVDRHYEETGTVPPRRNRADKGTNRSSSYDDDEDETDFFGSTYYDRDQLIPYEYKKHNGIGLYRPWMFNVKWNYWYARKFKPYVPGMPDRYSPIMTPYGMYPPGNSLAAVNPADALAAAGSVATSGPVASEPAMIPPGVKTSTAAVPPVVVPGPAPTNAPVYAASPTPPLAGGAYSPDGRHASPMVPWSYPSRYPTYAYGHGIHPGFDDVAYRPRHAGSYSPYVGYYGFGGRFDYGYGPYNYYWASASGPGHYGMGHGPMPGKAIAAPVGGYVPYGSAGPVNYSGFGWTGSFNYWLPQSGLQQ